MANDGLEGFGRALIENNKGFVKKLLFGVLVAAVAVGTVVLVPEAVHMLEIMAPYLLAAVAVSVPAGWILSHILKRDPPKW